MQPNAGSNPTNQDSFRSLCIDFIKMSDLQKKKKLSTLLMIELKMYFNYELKVVKRCYTTLKTLICFLKLDQI